MDSAPSALALADPVLCSRCQAHLPREVVEAREMAFCPACGAGVSTWVFPAILRRPAPILPSETAAVEGDATCFFHPGKTAVVPCSRCGRFLCRLCEVELRGESLCPECITSGMAKKKIAALENRRVCYDCIALAVATWPVLVTWYLTFLTALVTLYISIRYWRAPASIVGRPKLGFVAAILLALVELAVWAGVAVYLIAAAGRSAA